MTTEEHSRSLSLGRTVITPNALHTLDPRDVYGAITRHARGDWGEVCPQDAQENELSLRRGFRLMSVYSDRNGVKFWIITEADRSSTCCLLPEDY